MQYLLILSEDPGLISTPEQRQHAVERVGEFAMGLVGENVLRGGSPLHPVEEGKQVRVRDGKERVIDGPFAEGKEVIAGYMIIDVPDIGAAVEVALKCPNSEFGSVEIREIVPMG